MLAGMVQRIEIYGEGGSFASGKRKKWHLRKAVIYTLGITSTTLVL